MSLLKNQSKLYIALISVLIVVGATQEKSKIVEHSQSCPKKCEPCDNAIVKALKFLVSNQRKDGSWGQDGKHVNTGSAPSVLRNDNYILANTALVGLGLYASGSTTKEGQYQRELGLAQEAAMKLTRKIVDANDRYMFQSLPYAVFFLASVYQTEKSDNLKKLLEDVRDYFIKVQCKSGGWNYRNEKNNMIFQTNVFMLAILLLKHTGIKIEEKVFEGARQAYQLKDKYSGQADDGGYTYGHGIGDRNLPPASVGRTVGALLPMHLLGLSKSTNFTNAVEFSKKNMENLDNAQHGPSYHLFLGGLSCYFLKNDELWMKYWQNFRDPISSAQKEDGSIMIKPRKDAYIPLDDKRDQMGPIYTTPQYATILLLHKDNLLFHQLTVSGKKE